MNFKAHFDKLHDFLEKYRPWWFQEVLTAYPEGLEDYPADWIETLGNLGQEQLWRFDCRYPVKELEGTGINQFTKAIKELTALPQKEKVSSNLPSWAWRYVRGKKQHEIEQIVPIMTKLHEKKTFDHALDLGGGVGHLSRILALYYGIPCTSLDQSQEFQQLGKERLELYPHPEGAAKMNFVNITFGEEKATLPKLFTQNSFSLGLHTCGPLANELIQTNVDYQTRGLLNFGCCYSKLCPTKDTNLSNYAKQKATTLSQHGLTLATRGHTEISLSDFKLKEQVKRCRYGLHLLLFHELGIKEFVSVGEAKPSLYWSDFAIYAREKLAELNIEHHFSDEFFNNFIDAPHIQKLIHRMFMANLLRWQLGRVMEHFILTDRCLYLQEKGFEVEMSEYFDEKISPRNIGILAFKAHP